MYCLSFIVYFCVLLCISADIENKSVHNYTIFGGGGGFIRPIIQSALPKFVLDFRYVALFRKQSASKLKIDAEIGLY